MATRRWQWPSSVPVTFLFSGERNLFRPAEVLAGPGVYLNEIPDADERGHPDLQPGLQLRWLVLGGGRGTLDRWLGVDDLQIDRVRQFQTERFVLEERD